MAHEQKDDGDSVPNPEQCIAQRCLQFQENMVSLAIPLEHLSEEEIQGYSKKRLLDLAYLHDIRHGKNISKGQLISKILARRQEMLDDIASLERPREENTPNDVSPARA
jgi:hypothetical protein